MTNRNGRVLSRKIIREKRYYMLWDCSSCGTKGINANTCKQCPQCGNPKEDTEQEYRSSTLVDQNYEHTGADITCQQCGSENKHRFSCHNCGAPLDPRFEKQVKKFTFRTNQEWREAKVQVDSDGYLETATGTPWTENEPVSLEEPKEPAFESVGGVNQAARHGWAKTKNPSLRPVEATTRGVNKLWFGIITIAVMLSLAIGGYVYHQLHSLSLTEATAESVSWTYSLPLEDYAARSHSYETESSFWRPPGDAFSVSSYDVIVRYEPIYDQVWVPQTCTRTEDDSYIDTDGTWVSRTSQVTYDCSGYETQQVGQDPIHGTHWDWQQMEWARTNPLTAQGDSKVVVFPEFTPNPTLRQAGEPQTTFNITFSYFNNKGKNMVATRSYPRYVWETVNLKESYQSIMDGFNNLRAVESLDSDFSEMAKGLN